MQSLLRHMKSYSSVETTFARLLVLGIMLWLATPAVFLAAILLVASAYRRRKSAQEQTAPLSVNEQQRLKQLLDEK